MIFTTLRGTAAQLKPTLCTLIWPPTQQEKTSAGFKGSQIFKSKQEEKKKKTGINLVQGFSQLPASQRAIQKTELRMASIRHLLTKRPHTAWEHASAVGIKDCISTLRKRIPHPTWATPAHLLSRKMFAPSTGFACYWGFGIATITAAREHLPKMLAKKSHSCQSNTRQDTRLNACKKRAGFLLMGWVGQKRTLLSQVSSKCEDGFSFFPKLTPFLQ